MVNLKWVALVACLLVGISSVPALEVTGTGSGSAMLSTVVGLPLADVQASADVSPSVSIKYGSSAEARANAAAAIDSRVQILSNEDEERSIDGVTSSDAQVARATGVDADAFISIVAATNRRNVLSRIAEIRADAVANYRARVAAQAKAAQVMARRAAIVRMSGIDQAIARVDFARERAQLYGNSDVDVRLAAIRAKLQARKDAGQTVTAEDEAEVDTVIWFQHANRLSMEGERLIGVATSVDDALTRAISRMDTLVARVDASGNNSAMVRLNNIQSKGVDAQSELQANIANAQQALVTFKADSTVANARALNHALVRMNVAAQHGVNTVRMWVQLFNYWENHPADERVAQIAADADARVRTRAQIASIATERAQTALRSSLYGEASVAGGA